SGGRPSMLAVVTMEIDWSGQIANGLGETQNLLAGNAVVAKRNVDVAHAVPAGERHVRAGAIDRDNRLHAQVTQGPKAFLISRAAAAEELVRDAVNVAQALGV